MNKSIHDQTLALAGVFQASYLVHQVACHGMADSAAMEASIASIFKVDADNVEDVYGTAQRVSTGLRQLRDQIKGSSGQHAQQTRYVAALLFLQHKLMRRPPMLGQLQAGIERATAQAEHYPILHANVLANLADLYQNTISTLAPRIMVAGEQMHLANPGNANRVRSLLLAGIRSAVLWRQCGGSRWRLLLGRRKVLREAEALLAG